MYLRGIKVSCRPFPVFIPSPTPTSHLYLPNYLPPEPRSHTTTRPTRQHTSLAQKHCQLSQRCFPRTDTSIEDRVRPSVRGRIPLDTREIAVGEMRREHFFHPGKEPQGSLMPFLALPIHHLGSSNCSGDPRSTHPSLPCIVLIGATL